MKDTNRTGNIHKDETAEYHELNFPKIISVKPIDIPVINVSNQNPDFCSFVQKVSLVMLQKHFPKSHLRSIRFAQYDIALYQKERRRINTVVMYSGKYESAENELDMGSIKYKVQQIFMTKYDGIKRFEELKEMEVPKMFNTLEEIAKRDREKAKLECKVEGKVEERREVAIKLLGKRFGKGFTKEIEEKINEAQESRINQIIDNIFEITLEELKEILK
jgi:hypothetical protein